MKPKISIIVPVYNVEKYLRECLDSIISWSFSQWEAILIDDGSIDGSGRICDEYSEIDSRFYVIHKQNEGVSVARNIGLDNARGEWCWFVDSDDVIDIDTPFNNEILSGRDIVMFDILMFQDGTKLPKENKIMSYDVDTDLSTFYSKYITYNHQAIWYNRKFWGNEGNYSIRFTKGIKLGEDLEFMRKCELLATSPMKIHYTNYYYRLRSESACHRSNIGRRTIEDAFVILDNLYSFILKYNIAPNGGLLKRFYNLSITIPQHAVKDNLWGAPIQRKYKEQVKLYDKIGVKLSSSRYIYIATKMPFVLNFCVKTRAFIIRMLH